MDSCDYSKLPVEDIESHDAAGYPIKPKASQEKCKGKCKCKRRIKVCLKVLLKLMCVLFLFLAAAGTVVGIKVHKWVAREVKEWTVTEPQELPVVKVTKEELKAFKLEAKEFKHSIQGAQVGRS